MGVNYFLNNQTYSCKLVVRIRDGYDRYFSGLDNKNITINGNSARMHSISFDLKEVTIQMNTK